MVQNWNKHVALQNSFLRLHTKMQRTKRFRLWTKSVIGNNKLLLIAARQLIGILDVVQEQRPLSLEELILKRDLKNRYLAMTAIEKLRARQQYRMTYIRAGDANSKFFFLGVTGRRRKKFIQTLETPRGSVHLQAEKQEAILQHFQNGSGKEESINETLNWELLNIQRHNLQFLEEEFTEEEINAVVMDQKLDKAPGLDGFIGIFFKTSWDIIKEDLTLAVQFFYNQHGQHFNILNSAQIILVPKKNEAKRITNYKPISLTSSIAKLISKLLASRLAQVLNDLVSRNQSAFIRKRSIHDNYLYTQNLIRELHKQRRPTLFLKLDIAKAFDTLRWDYLMEVMEQMGFGIRWREWVSILPHTATSILLVNGSQTRNFRHRTGLRQGDPLSPMLFILALQPLKRLLTITENESTLSPIQGRTAKLRISLYADDAVMFVNTVREEIEVIRTNFDAFGRVSGLKINLDKSAAYPIRCEGLDISSIMERMPCQIKTFPCKYLGLPLSLRKLTRIEIEPLIDRVAAKLLVWKVKVP